MVRKLKRWEKITLQSLLVAVVLIAGFMTAMLIYLSRDLPSMARLEMIEPSLKTRIQMILLQLRKSFMMKPVVFTPPIQVW